MISLSGGFSSSIAGGDFWRGFGIAATVGLVNHAGHVVSSSIKSNIYVRSARAFLEDLGFDAAQVQRDVVKQSDGFFGLYYAELKNYTNYTTGWSVQIDSRTGHPAFVSPERVLDVNVSSMKWGSFTNPRGFALKFYPGRNNSIGIIRIGMAHYQEAFLEIIDGAVRQGTGIDNFIYNMHKRNSNDYLRWR